MVAKTSSDISGDLWRRHMEMSAIKQVFFRRKADLTPGVDRVNAVSFERAIDPVLESALEKIEAEKFRFSPYLELLIFKGKNNFPRVVVRPTIRDKLILIALKEVLHESFLRTCLAIFQTKSSETL